MENGQDLLDMVTHSRVIDTDDEDIDYSAFRVFVLRAGGRVVSVATLRYGWVALGARGRSHLCWAQRSQSGHGPCVERYPMM